MSISDRVGLESYPPSELSLSSYMNAISLGKIGSVKRVRCVGIGVGKKGTWRRSERRRCVEELDVELDVYGSAQQMESE